MIVQSINSTAIKHQKSVLHAMHFDHRQASARLEKPGRLRTLRRDIARIETRISQLRNQAA